MSRRAVLVSFVASLLFIVIAPPTGASVEPPTAETHCLATVESSSVATGELTTVSYECFATLEQALTAAGVPPELVYGELDEPTAPASSVGITSSLPPLLNVLTDFNLGVHYENLNYSGATYTVTGSNCAGGYVNLPAEWNNRVSSTANGCNRINHFDTINIGGASESTFPSGNNLSSLDNRSSSIQYTT